MAGADNSRQGFGATELETVAAHRNLTRAEFRWLALALLAHAVLLSLPLGRDRPPAESPQPLSVDLSVRHPPPGPREPATARELPVPELPAADPPAPARPGEAHEAPREPEFVRPASASRATGPDDGRQPASSMTAARLLELARETGRGTPRSVPMRRLGEPPVHDTRPGPDLPASGLAAALAGSFAPSAPEIVDRWLAADGSHNVVVVLPNGETVCGRGQAWDPMRPLVEHVMMFRTCGGGGERTFSMPEDARPGYSMPD